MRLQAVARGIKRLPANASITAAEELVRSSILRECRAFNRRKPEVIIGGLPCCLCPCQLMQELYTTQGDLSWSVCLVTGVRPLITPQLERVRQSTPTNAGCVALPAVA